MDKEQLKKELKELFKKEQWTIEDHYRYKKLSDKLWEIERNEFGI